MHGHDGWGNWGDGDWGHHCGGGGFGWFLPALIVGKVLSDTLGRGDKWPAPQTPPPPAPPQTPPAASAAQPAAHCPRCNAETPAQFSFCPQCGQRLSPALCPYCGCAVKPGAAQCAHCGAPAR